MHWRPPCLIRSGPTLVQPCPGSCCSIVRRGVGAGLGHGTTTTLTASCRDNTPLIHLRFVVSTTSSSVHVGADMAARHYSFLLPHSDTRLSNHNTGRVSPRITSLRLPHDLCASCHLVLEAQRVGDERQKAQPPKVSVGVLFSCSLLYVFLLLWSSCILYPWTSNAGLYHSSSSSS